LKTELIWTTPNGDELVARMARVSNPANENNNATAPRLIAYLMRNKHWSPLEMVNACVYIECPRDISRQILRHRSFSFQEFSGRYAVYDDLLTEREGRLQDHANRQNSITLADKVKAAAWEKLVALVRSTCITAYRSALDLGIAKEVARALLPEGLVPTRLYMNGTLRSWVHYFQIRCSLETQKEHREVAEACRKVIFKEFPLIAEAVLDN
jgi:thymidylate synthase (FAD)